MKAKVMEYDPPMAHVVLNALEEQTPAVSLMFLAPTKATVTAPGRQLRSGWHPFKENDAFVQAAKTVINLMDSFAPKAGLSLRIRPPKLILWPVE